jgi:uncharacterized protein YqjF (DUF2071 family)
MNHVEWKDALFLHYEADPIALEALLPPELIVDTCKGKAYIGVVALSELGITPTFLPQWLRRLLALSHHAVNVRTYVRYGANGRPGIYFFTLDCSHFLPAMGACLLFNLPYRLAAMTRQVLNGGTLWLFKSSRRFSHAQLEVEWKIDEDAVSTHAASDSLPFFFVERYCLYNTSGSFLRLLGQSRLWRGSISHRPWPVKEATVTNLHNTVLAAVGGMNEAIVPRKAPLAHFSKGVNDISFYFERISEEENNVKSQ